MAHTFSKVTALGSLALFSIRCGDELPPGFGRKPAPNLALAGAPSEAGSFSSSGESGCDACGGSPNKDPSPSEESESPDGEGGTSSAEGEAGSAGEGSEPLSGGAPGEPPRVASNAEAGAPSEGGAPGGTTPEPSPLFQAVRGLLEEHCVSCHATSSHAIFTDDATLYTRLTEPLTTNTCSGRVLVVPNAPEESLLLGVIRGETDCVRRMPFGCELGVGSCLGDEAVSAVRDWIIAGAPE